MFFFEVSLLRYATYEGKSRYMGSEINFPGRARPAHHWNMSTYPRARGTSKNFWKIIPLRWQNHCLDARREIWFLRRSQCIDIGVGNEVHSTALRTTLSKYPRLTTNRSPKCEIPFRASAVRNNYANLQILKLLLRKIKHKMCTCRYPPPKMLSAIHINR